VETAFVLPTPALPAHREGEDITQLAKSLILRKISNNAFSPAHRGGADRRRGTLD